MSKDLGLESLDQYGSAFLEMHTEGVSDIPARSIYFLDPVSRDQPRANPRGLGHPRAPNSGVKSFTTLLHSCNVPLSRSQVPLSHTGIM